MWWGWWWSPGQHRRGYHGNPNWIGIALIVFGIIMLLGWSRFDGPFPWIFIFVILPAAARIWRSGEANRSYHQEMDDEKAKNDAVLPQNEYIYFDENGQPKRKVRQREPRYVLGDDGEIIETWDYIDDPNAAQADPAPRRPSSSQRSGDGIEYI
ncbi:MAG: hypothetical protein GYB67_00810 [Chloroflexi bacterium]|nr:hypothetical protein [Chloroflexota bacterium]